ncbi:MAG: deoxyguanosinetriphosphate triphosphohydrolase [Pseudonocardiales bacterium]|nr:MAG: deoxyguanosinetriphosphate triphosphohydrolase [Pseudonocardiales bacterium]
MSTYDEHSRARRHAEPVKAARARRSEFQRDRARVLHSAALRRLAGKTQVVVAGEDDFPRTRLTHSLECAQIGRELGEALGCDPDLVDAACLAHDIGHPPYGHNGETALDEVAQACGGFEGNAQTLRILTRLEAKVLDGEGNGAGLNLTRATLDAATKYPWPRGDDDTKYGAYAEDLPAFDWIREGAPARARCLEAQVMDWADDVAYSVHDVEDGIHAGHVLPGALADADERSAVCRTARDWGYTDESAGDLAAAFDGLLALPAVVTLPAYDGSVRAQAALKRLTSELTGRFVSAAIEATREKYGDEALTRYDADLVVPAAVRTECALLKGLAAHYVMNRDGAREMHDRQREIINELAAALADRAPDALDTALRPAWHEATDDAGRLRAVVDQVARLTDASVLDWHRRLVVSRT